MKYNTVLATIEDSVLIITLNRPDKRNSLNQEIIKELKDVLLKYRNDQTIYSVIITGAGKAFCAGADLAYLKSLLKHDYEKNLQDSLELKDLYYMIYTYPKPTLAMVNGPAVAGGCGLVNVCDFVFSTQSAKFGYPEVRIGFVASMVSIFLIQTIGERHAKELLLKGDLLTPIEAKDIGLIDKIIPENEIKEVSMNFLIKLKYNSQQSLDYSKQLFHRIFYNDLENKLIKACEFNARTRNTEDFKEGINSFLEKRKPKWQESL